MRNDHELIIGDGELSCAAKGCDWIVYVGSASTDAARGSLNSQLYFDRIAREHSSQFDEGAAPNIEIEYELSAGCSVCPDKIGDVVCESGETIMCRECGTTWDMEGTMGEVDVDQLEELRDEDHGLALAQQVYEQAKVVRATYTRTMTFESMARGRGEVYP